MNWLGFSLLAVGLWGLWGFLSKLATLQLSAGAAYLMSIAGHLAVIAFLAATGGLAIPWQPAGLAAALAAGICMAFGLLFFFRALAGGAASVVVPLTSLYPLITVVLSWAILQEDFTLRRLVGVALALVAVWLLSK
ncbi:MAG: EamA family transporter [Deltaproteobacteria bacterium]|nr:EamA family transporter [Deltaproteobacteria bacterium]